MKTQVVTLGILWAVIFTTTHADAQFRPIETIRPIQTPLQPPLQPLQPLQPVQSLPQPLQPLPQQAQPLTGSPPPPNAPVTVGQAFVVAVCAGIGNYSDECQQRGELEATEKLIQFYVKQYAKRLIQNSLTVHFPDVASQTEQLRFLSKVEKQVIKAVELKLKTDVAQLTPFHWDTEQDRLNKQAVVDETAKTVKKWGDKARSEADDGSNWSHDWSSNSHKFNEGEAYQQLKHISIHGWTNQ